MCARFQANPKGVHLRAVKRIMRYLDYTPKFGLCYPKGSTFDLIGYSDADYAGCKIDRKRTSGTCQFLGWSLVSWASKKQNSIALSTAEAEYIAAVIVVHNYFGWGKLSGTMAINWAKSRSYVIMRVQSAWRIIPLNTTALNTKTSGITFWEITNKRGYRNSLCEHPQPISRYLYQATRWENL
jgi:hypothetical protein